MSHRTTIVLAVIAVGLLGFIFLYEQHTLSSGELAERGDRLLERFVRDKVTKLEIERDGKRTVLVREYEDEEDEVGTWKLVEPVRAPVDDEAVEALMGNLEWADARRELERVGKEDRQRFGLDDPELRAWFTVSKERVPIVFGKADPTEGGYYAQLDDPGTAYVVGKDLFEAFDHPAGHFRSKELFPERDATDATSLSLDGPEARRRLTRREDRWWLVEPFEAWADPARTRAAVDALLTARATRFVEESPDDLSAYGLEASHVRARAEGREGDGEEAETWSLELTVGSPCEGHPKERHARAGDGPVVCISDQDIAALERSAEELRESRLSAVSEQSLTGAEVARGGTRLVLSRTEQGGWRWKAGGSEGAADAEAVAEWVRTLHETAVADFEPIDADGAGEHGLAQPRATLTLRTESGPETVLYLGASSSEGAWIRRGSEPFAARVAAEVVAAFEPSQVRFRDRRLVSEKDESAARLVVERGGTTERVRRGEGGEWQVEEPLQAPADRVIVRQLVRHLAHLEAERFVAPSARPEHGLGSPRWLVTVRFEGGAQEGEKAKAGAAQEHVLRVGAEAPGGAYAQLGSDPAVFVVPQGLVDAVEQPLISRDLLATDGADVATLWIARGGTTITLECEEGRCATAAGAPADRERTRKLLDRLAALRASAVSDYGPPTRGAGLGSPRARVTVERVDGADGPQEYTFLVGATEGEGDAARTHVRRDDLAVGYLFPSYVVDSFVDYQP